MTQTDYFLVLLNHCWCSTASLGVVMSEYVISLHPFTVLCLFFLSVWKSLGLPHSRWVLGLPFRAASLSNYPSFSLNPFFCSIVILSFPLGSLPQIINRSQSHSSSLKLEKTLFLSLLPPAVTHRNGTCTHTHTHSCCSCCLSNS